MDQKTIVADIHRSPRMRHKQVVTSRNEINSKSFEKPPTIAARYAYEKFGYSIEKGEELMLLNKTNQDWWEVQKYSGEVGFVPAIYLHNIGNTDVKVVKLHMKKPTGKAEAEKSQPLSRIKQDSVLETDVKHPQNVDDKASLVYKSNEHPINHNKAKQEHNLRSQYYTDGKENSIPQRNSLQSLKQGIQSHKLGIQRPISTKERMYRVKSLPESQWPKDNFKSQLPKDNFKSQLPKDNLKHKSTHMNNQSLTVNFSGKEKHFGSLETLVDPKRKTSHENIPDNITDWTMKKKLEPKVNLGSTNHPNKMLGPKSPAEKHASLWQRSFPVAKNKDKKQDSMRAFRAMVSTADTSMKNSVLKEHYITQALKADKGDGASLLKWSTKTLPGKGDIMSCKVETVFVTYMQNGKEQLVSYVAKINPHNNIPGFEDITNSIVKREAIFYSQIAPKLNSEMRNNNQEALKIPKLLYVNIEDSPEVIILEDLYAAGYIKAIKKKGLSVDETKLVITELARFHAASIILDRKMQLGRQYPGMTPHNITKGNKDEKTILENILKTGITLLSQLGGYNKAVQWLNEAQPRVQNMFNSCISNSGVLKVLCHGDCLIDNIFFRYNDEGIPVDVKLINFQACMLGSPALDLNYLLFSSLNGSNRQPNTETFLTLYVNVLQQVLSTSKEPISITHEQIKKEYKSKNPYGILIGLSSVSAQVSEERDIPVVLGSEKGVAHTMNMFSVEWQARQSILLKKNPALAPRLAAIADDIINYSMTPIESSM